MPAGRVTEIEEHYVLACIQHNDERNFPLVYRCVSLPHMWEVGETLASMGKTRLKGGESLGGRATV